MMIPAKTVGLWPGLPRLWYQGNPASLAIAVFFALLLNTAIVSTFIYPLLLSTWTTRGLWLIVFIASCTGFLYTFKDWDEILGFEPKDENQDQLFEEAQNFYLRGEYFEAEASLHRIFATGRQDVEAAVLMVSILRRTRRWTQALYCIDRLMLLEKAAYWARDLQIERKRILESMESEKAKGIELSAGSAG